MITEWPIPLVLQRVRDSIDGYRLDDPGDWQEMIAQKMADASGPALIADMQSKGQLDPICIFQEWGRWNIGNGHHRLCVAILLGFDSVLVDDSDSWALSSDRNGRTFRSEYPDADGLCTSDESRWLSGVLSEEAE